MKPVSAVRSSVSADVELTLQDMARIHLGNINDQCLNSRCLFLFLEAAWEYGLISTVYNPLLHDAFLCNISYNSLEIELW